MPRIFRFSDLKAGDFRADGPGSHQRNTALGNRESLEVLKHRGSKIRRTFKGDYLAARD